MFVGHYAVGFAAKAVDKRMPLWLLFIASQAVDIAWATLVLLGVEKLRIVPGITAANPFDFHYYPYTHSLLASFIWLAVAATAYRLLRAGEGGWRSGLIVGVAVFSHWMLDLLTHRPDLPLYDDALKVGLGLWNYPLFSFFLEAALLLGGMWLYLRTVSPARRAGRSGIVVFGIVLFVTQGVNSFGPPPTSAAAVAAIGLVSYIASALVAYWLEKTRQ